MLCSCKDDVFLKLDHDLTHIVIRKFVKTFKITIRRGLTMSKVKEDAGLVLVPAEKDRKFREALWHLVDQSGKTERQICQQLGRNSGYINKLLNGKAGPSYNGILELAEYFNVGIGELFGEK